MRGAASSVNWMCARAGALRSPAAKVADLRAMMDEKASRASCTNTQLLKDLACQDPNLEDIWDKAQASSARLSSVQMMHAGNQSSPGGDAAAWWIGRQS